MSFPLLRYYGCGLVVPERLENCQILDLGCGSGRDCYMLSQLVGEKGHVTGIDMTKAQVRQRFGGKGRGFARSFFEAGNCFPLSFTVFRTAGVLLLSFVPLVT